jgi:hypothetical protein
MTLIPSPCRKPTNHSRGLVARLACAAALSAFAVASPAEVVTERFDFTATGFVDPDITVNETPPFTAASGSFTVTFDNTRLVGNTTGVIVNSWSPMLSDSAVAYTYSYPYSGGHLSIGGIASGGVHGMHNFGISDYDFLVKFSNVASTPSFHEMFYVVPGSHAGFHTRTGSVTMTVVPEPAPLALLVMILVSQRRSRCRNTTEQN